MRLAVGSTLLGLEGERIAALVSLSPLSAFYRFALRLQGLEESAAQRLESISLVVALHLDIGGLYGPGNCISFLPLLTLVLLQCQAEICRAVPLADELLFDLSLEQGLQLQFLQRNRRLITVDLRGDLFL